MESYLGEQSRITVLMAESVNRLTLFHHALVDLLIKSLEAARALACRYSLAIASALASEKSAGRSKQ